MLNFNPLATVDRRGLPWVTLPFRKSRDGEKCRRNHVPLQRRAPRMCGVAGIYAYGARAEKPSEIELLKIRDRMISRGPDDAGLWWSPDQKLGFAHRRLAIQDLSERGHQPMVSADGRYVITYNGEIYNHPELRAELEQQGVIYRSDCDTETLLHLYTRLGGEMIHKLRGMFAFAIWDQVKEEIFLARDLYGIKPLYYADDGKTFRFASQVKALLAGQKIDLTSDPAGIVGFYLWGHVPDPFTLYRAIRALPAGHTLRITRRGSEDPRRYSSIAEIIETGTRKHAPGDVGAVVKHAALDSVRHHLLADVQVGVFLSAGIDSGAILGLVRDAGALDPLAITLGFREFLGTNQDEVPLASVVARQYGARHITRTVDEAEFRNDLSGILEAMDQPSIDGVNTWFVAKAAREAGLKVALSGLGGDELLAGYPSFVDLPRWRRSFGLATIVPGIGRFARHLMDTFNPGMSVSRPKARYMLDYAGSWEGAYLLRRGLYLPEELVGLMDPEILREGMQKVNPLARLSTCLRPDPGSDVGRVCVLESVNYMRNQLLRDVDWAGMAHSLEIRTPFVDRVLLEAVAPALSSLMPGEGKRALALAPTNPLPASHIQRAKTGFGVPIEKWIRSVVSTPENGKTAQSMGLVSRRWSRYVLRCEPRNSHEMGLRH